MRVLLVNLKLFYQCRPLWSTYIHVTFFLLIIGGALPHLFRSNLGDAEGISFTWMGIICAISMAVGTIVATMQMGVISTPLSFCLPDHRVVFRKLVLLVGLVLSLVVLLIEFANAPPLSLSPVFLFGLSLAVYFAGVGISLASRYGLMGVAFGGLFLPMGGILLDLKEPKEFVAITVPAVALILLGVGMPWPSGNGWGGRAYFDGIAADLGICGTRPPERNTAGLPRRPENALCLPQVPMASSWES